jgi:hypothetical protein
MLIYMYIYTHIQTDGSSWALRVRPGALGFGDFLTAIDGILLAKLLEVVMKLSWSGNILYLQEGASKYYIGSSTTDIGSSTTDIGSFCQ